jgi:hypothetical protein
MDEHGDFVHSFCRAENNAFAVWPIWVSGAINTHRKIHGLCMIQRRRYEVCSQRKAMSLCVVR